MATRIIHLVDDTTPGGVVRTLDHLVRGTDLGINVHQEQRLLSRASWRAPKLRADVIVSHLAIGWSRLPQLTQLRALHPDVPMVHVEHSYTEGFAATNAVPVDRFETMLSASYALFERIVAVSHGQARWLTRRGFVPAERLAVIPSCVDLAPFLAIEPVRSSQPRRFGLFGRLAWQKGFDMAIRAFREGASDDMTLEIFGEGPQDAELRQIAGDDGRIRFHGWTDPQAAMTCVDVVLMPSRWEAFGLVALEAQAAGRLVLVSQVDGLTDHVGGGAIAIGGNSVEAWAEAIAGIDRMNAPCRALRGQARGQAQQGAFADSWREMLADVTLPAQKARAA